MKNTNLIKILLFSLAVFIFNIVTSLTANSGLLSFTLPSGLPNYNEVHIQGIGSSLYVNTEVTGKVVVAREINQDKTLGKKYYFNFNQISDNWAEMEFDNPITNFNEIILLGTKGNILLKKSSPGEDILVYSNGTNSGNIVSRLGLVNGTIYFPDTELLDIDSIGIGIQRPDGEKLKGNILVATVRSIAFEFKGVNADYIKNGKSNLVIRLRLKSINLDIDSWGYSFDVERLEPDKLNLLSNVFGLDPSKKLMIEYETYEGQMIEPLSTTFTVEEINRGRPIAVVKDDNKPIKFDLILAN